MIFFSFWTWLVICLVESSIATSYNLKNLSNVAAVNAWRLRNLALKAHGIAFNMHEHNYLNFVRDLVERLIKCHGKISQSSIPDIGLDATSQETDYIQEARCRREVR